MAKDDVLFLASTHADCGHCGKATSHHTLNFMWMSVIEKATEKLAETNMNFKIYKQNLRN